MFLKTGRLGAAREALDETRRLLQRTNDLPTLSQVLARLGCLHLLTGEFEEARNVSTEADGLIRAVAHPEQKLKHIMMLRLRIALANSDSDRAAGMLNEMSVIAAADGVDGLASVKTLLDNASKLFDEANFHGFRLDELTPETRKALAEQTGTDKLSETSETPTPDWKSGLPQEIRTLLDQLPD